MKKNTLRELREVELTKPDKERSRSPTRTRMAHVGETLAMDIINAFLKP